MNSLATSNRPHGSVRPCLSRRPQAPVPATRSFRTAARRVVCRADTGTDSKITESKDATSSTELSTDDEELRKLSKLRRQGQQQLASGSSENMFKGAIEQAQLITWPRPQKAFSDTILVLFIVTLTGGMLLGINLALTSISEFWYHRG